MIILIRACSSRSDSRRRSAASCANASLNDGGEANRGDAARRGDAAPPRRGGAGARRGILFRNAAALESLQRIDMLLFNKTETLTLWELVLEEIRI